MEKIVADDLKSLPIQRNYFIYSGNSGFTRYYFFENPQLNTVDFRF